MKYYHGAAPASQFCLFLKNIRTFIQGLAKPKALHALQTGLARRTDQGWPPRQELSVSDTKD
jgi:hypothetical protein